MALNQPDQALEAINRGLSESPGMEPLLLMRGRIFQGLGRNSEAGESFQEAASRYPHSSESHYHYGQFLYACGQWIEAASEFQASQNIKPDHGPGQFQMAVALNKLGRNEEALSAARRAAELLPNELTAHRFYQDLAITMGKRAEVIADYLNLVEQNSQSGLHQYLYGRVLDDPEAAQFRFELAAHHAPNAFWPLYALGIQACLRRDYESARDFMESAAKTTEPEADRANLYLCLIDIAERKYAEAETAARNLLKQSPKDLRVYALLHQIALERMDYDGAEKLYQEIESGVPGSLLPVLFFRLEAALQSGNREQFQRLSDYLLYEFRQPLPPHDRETFALTLAAAAIEEGQYESAAARLEEASASGALTQGRALFWVGWVKSRTGNEEAAKALWSALAEKRSRFVADEDLFYSSAARYLLSGINEADFEAALRYLRVENLNDYWTVRGLKARAEKRDDDARLFFQKAIEESRGKEFPARLAEAWSK
jgi:predicted Zn-dependent protease